MARYRALGPIFMRRLIAAGEEFESDLPPGRNWQPLDKSGEVAVAHMQNEQGPRRAALARMDNVRPAPDAIDIPPDWETLSKPQKRGLAMKLGAPGTVTAADAETFITAHLERRAQKAA